MGIALDEGKVIPKNDTTGTGTGFGRGLERLLELFPAWFNTWEWKDGHYTEYLSNPVDSKKQGVKGFKTFKDKWDYTYGNDVKFNEAKDCDQYPIPPLLPLL